MAPLAGEIDLGAFGFTGPAPDIGAYELPHATPATADIHLTIGPRRVAPGDTYPDTGGGLIRAHFERDRSDERPEKREREVSASSRGAGEGLGAR